MCVFVRLIRLCPSGRAAWNWSLSPPRLTPLNQPTRTEEARTRRVEVSGPIPPRVLSCRIRPVTIYSKNEADLLPCPSRQAPPPSPY